MLWTILLSIVGLAGALLALYLLVFVPWTLRWGATPAECAAPLTGDDWPTAAGFPERWRIRPTRAVTIAAPPEDVWPWVAQLGRGAGWYSYDRLDNGGKTSAEHVVSWVPAPRLGDASAIGYVRAVTPGREIAWWVSPQALPGVRYVMSAVYALAAEGPRTRLVCRFAAAGRGWLWPAFAYLFLFIDAWMARRQLLGIRERAERFGARGRDPDRPETGARDQFQHFEVIYADGLRGGVPGKEGAARFVEPARAELGDRLGTGG